MQCCLMYTVERPWANTGDDEQVKNHHRFPRFQDLHYINLFPSQPFSPSHYNFIPFLLHKLYTNYSIIYIL